jgi:hypothetical protein
MSWTPVNAAIYSESSVRQERDEHRCVLFSIDYRINLFIRVRCPVRGTIVLTLRAREKGHFQEWRRTGPQSLDSIPAP